MELSVRIRIVHARLRHLLSASSEWDTEAWGTRISAAHLGCAILAFPARLLQHMKTLGAEYNAKSMKASWQFGATLGI